MMTYRVFTGILPPCCSPGASATSCACVWLCGSLAQTCKLKGNFKKKLRVRLAVRVAQTCN